MPLSDSELVAMFADMEALRVDAAHQRDLLDAERRRALDLADRVRRLDDHLGAALERQRELHVLLLHRDEEIAGLRGQSRAMPELASGDPAPRPVAGSRPPARRAVPRASAWEHVVANAWYRFMNTAQRPRGDGRDRDERP